MKNKIALLAQVVIGVVFILSAYSKFIAPGIVEIILVDHGIAHSRETAAVLVRVLIGLEFGIGFMFLQPFSIKQIAIPVASLFLIGFTLYLLYSGFILKDTQNCGCFGVMIKMSPFESIIKNVVLMILIGTVYKTKTLEKKNYILPPIVLVIAVAAVFLANPVKDPSKFVFSRYTDFIGKGRVDLSYGDKIVAVFNLECDHCQETARELAELQRHDRNFPEVYVLFFKEAENTPETFDKMTNSNFPYTMISAKEFFDLIGVSPPRLYWLHKGQIKEYWDADFVKHVQSIKEN